MDGATGSTFIDLRSDTVTRPTAAMREAMRVAPVGDDVFGDDPTVIALERRVATLLGKEAALYVPSGTMANQLAVRVHCRPGDEAIVHRGCHILNHEGGAAAALSGVTLRTLDSADGSLEPEAVQAALQLDDDPHHSPTALVALENTHNACGGVVVPQANAIALAALLRPLGVKLHLDGARLANAAMASGLSLAELAQPYDSATLCLSKGLGAPMGSLVSGSAEFIAQVRRWRKRFGGGMRQVGIVAAAGLYALDHHVERLADDHRRARCLAEAIAAHPHLSIDLAKVQTNLVYFDVARGNSSGAELALRRVTLVAQLRELGVLIMGGPSRLRAVTHLDIDDAAIDRTIEAFARIGS